MNSPWKIVLSIAIFLIIPFLFRGTMLAQKWSRFGNAPAVIRVEKEESENFSAERDEYRYLLRQDENGQVPFGALVRAKSEVDAMRVQSQLRKGIRTPQDGGIGGWDWLGPGNIGGRIRSILVNPDNTSTIWVGSVSGGIWRTDDAGASWYPLNDFMANLAVTSIVMDPTNHNVLYASTGEGVYSQHFTGALQGAGIFKSFDGGLTWSQLATTNNNNFTFVYKLAHHPSAANTLLAATKTGLWKSIDGGGIWSPLSPDVTYNTPFDIAYCPTNGNRVLFSTVKCLYYSTNGGGAWSRQNSGGVKLPPDSTDFRSAFSVVGNAMYVSKDANKGEIWRSVDNGVSWNLMNTGSNYISQGGVHAIWVDPTDSNTVVVGGLNIYRSRNGGINLDRISDWVSFPDGGPFGAIHSAHADNHVFVSPPDFDGLHVKTLYVGNDGGIQRTADVYAAGNGGLGDGWDNLAHNLGITQFYGGAATSDGSVIIGGAQDNGEPTLVSPNGPNNWAYVKEGDGGISAIDEVNQKLYEEYVYLKIQRDDGLGYHEITSGLGDANNPRHALFVSPFSMDPNNPTILVAGGTSIWRTINKGDAWTKIRDSLGMPGPMCSAIDIQKGNSSAIWVGYTDGTLSRTTDGGASWMNVDNNGLTPLPNRAVTDIAINPSNGNEVFVTVGGYNADDVWMTADLGASWTRRTGSGPTALPNIQVNTIRYHPTNTNWVYIGTDLGVFASEDKGGTWSLTPLYSQNEGPANVEVDELFWQGTDYLIAATHGRGMFRTKIFSDIYVDINNSSIFQFGTQAFPFEFIQSAITAAGNGSNIIINPGDYRQAPLIFNKRGLVIAPSGGVVIH